MQATKLFLRDFGFLDRSMWTDTVGAISQDEIPNDGNFDYTHYINKNGEHSYFVEFKRYKIDYHLHERNNDVWTATRIITVKK